MELECDLVSTANGSARLRLANSDILVGVKTEIDTPSPESPGLGKLEFFVDWWVFESFNTGFNTTEQLISKNKSNPLCWTKE